MKMRDISTSQIDSSCYAVLDNREQRCTKPRFALKNPTLQPYSMFIWLYSIFLLFRFVYLFIYFDTPWDVRCILSVPHICDTDSGKKTETPGGYAML